VDILHIDFESGSAVELGDVGVHKYAEHWSTHVYCMAYRFNDEEKQIWYMWESFPQRVIDHVAGGGIVVAHNASFERALWNVVLPRPNLIDGYDPIPVPRMQIDQMVCTMARAAALALPGGLDYIARVMGAESRKDDVGGKLMMKFAKPLTRTMGEDGRETYTFYRDREDMLKVGDYCLQDVEVETEIDRLLLQHKPRERSVWLLDQKINDRGVKLDLELVKVATEVADVGEARLHKRMAEITEGAVPSCTQVAKLVAWINSRGIPCTSIAKGVQTELIAAASVLDPTVEEAIRLRQAAGKGTPTSKYQTMLDCAGFDGKARGQLMYHGATTGRWAGRLIQFQNLPGVDPDRDLANVEAVVAILGCPHLGAEEKADAIQMLTGSIMPVLSKSLRHMLVASAGCRFIGGDLSNIEGCVAAWLAGEEWKVEAYREYQAKRGPDLYIATYCRTFGADLSEVDKFRRQIGKVIELACGFGGGIGAFISAAKIYNIDLKTLVAPVKAITQAEVWAKAEKRYETTSSGNRYGLELDVWCAVRITVDNWRNSHPAITGGWYDLQDAAIHAVSTPGEVVEIFGGKVAYVYARQVLWCKLPSGRALAYHRPWVKKSTTEVLKNANGETKVVEEDEIVEHLKDGWVQTGENGPARYRVMYEGYDNTSKRWTRFSLYGGHQFENIVQAIARDVMVEGMFRAEAKGYPIVLTVHDELLTDVPVGHGSVAELQQIMSTVPDWAEGLPLAAKTWEDFRYAK